MLNYRKQSRLTFSKCQALWNKQNRSSQMADVIKTNLGVYLKLLMKLVGTVSLIPQDYIFSILKTVLQSSIKCVMF